MIESKDLLGDKDLLSEALGLANDDDKYGSAINQLLEAKDLFSEALNLADSQADREATRILIDEAEKSARKILLANITFQMKEVEEIIRLKKEYENKETG